MGFGWPVRLVPAVSFGLGWLLLWWLVGLAVVVRGGGLWWWALG